MNGKTIRNRIRRRRVAIALWAMGVPVLVMWALSACPVQAADRADVPDSSLRVEDTAGRMTQCATPLFKDAALELDRRFPGRNTAAKRTARGGPYHSVGDSMTFWAWDLTVMPPAWIQVPATCRALGDYCYVFVADDQWNVNMDQADVDLVVEAWDTSTPADPARGIYELNTANFGPPPDSHDNDDWIYIFYSALGEFSGSVFDGYFSAFNQYTEEEAQNMNPPAHSNEVEMFYMSCDPVDPSAISTLSVLAHEFEHMIHWNMDPNETSWVDEGCAEYAMFLYGHPDPIVSFPGNPDDDLTQWDQSFADYIQTYLFMMYLHDHYGGADTLSALVAEPANSIQGVDNTLAGQGYGETFTDVIYDWFIANYLDDGTVGDGRYGYDSIDLPSFSNSGNHDQYPVVDVARTVNHWAADYIRFRQGTGLTLDFQGTGSQVFGLQLIKMDQTTPTEVLPLDLDSGQNWTDSFSDFGDLFDTMVLVPSGLSSTGSTEYQYSAWSQGSGVPALIAAPGPGMDNPNQVKGFGVDGVFNGATDFDAFPALEGFGARLAAGDLDLNGTHEIVAGPGPGSDHPPTVRAFAADGTPVSGVNFTAYGVQKYGVNVSCGDFDGDGYDEIVTGPGPGAVFGPHVRGWNVDGGTAQAASGVSFLAYGTTRWGANVCCGDIDGDGYDEIVTGAGPGAVFGPHVRAWNVDGGTAGSIPGVSYFAYGTHKYGVNVSCGDIDGDGYDEIITGAGPGAVFGPHVRGWNYDGQTLAAIPAVSYLAYGTNKYGVRVSAGDVDNDGIDELITTPGPGGVFGAHVRGWNYDGAAMTAIQSISFFAFDTQYRFGADAVVALLNE